MIDFRPGLVAFLAADTQIRAALGDASRIYPLRLPQGLRAAAIVYTRISGLGDHTMEGASGLARPRVQIDAWDVSLDGATQLADLIKQRIDGYRGLMGSVKVQGVFFDSERENYDAAVEMFRASRDYFIWFEER